MDEETSLVEVIIFVLIFCLAIYLFKGQVAGAESKGEIDTYVPRHLCIKGDRYVANIHGGF